MKRIVHLLLLCALSTTAAAQSFNPPMNATDPKEFGEVLLAEDAKALNRVMTRDTVDLIVLDLMLPGEDGLSICRRLAIFHRGGTMNFNVNGHPFQFRSQYEKMVENKPTVP